MKRNILPALLFSALVLAVTGCASVPDPASIPPDTTVLELSQLGQESIDDNNYKAAEVYYQTIIDRYGTDAKSLTAAEFEIAHIRMKKKNWSEASTLLEGIIARYETTGGTGLPPEYLVLAKNDLARIPAESKPAEAKPAEAEKPAEAGQTAE